MPGDGLRGLDLVLLGQLGHHVPRLTQRLARAHLRLLDSGRLTPMLCPGDLPAGPPAG
jgi:hypothetical protein